MMSDVPEGVFLSGGLDSTAVLAFTREATTGPLPTFTLGYDDPSFSEWEYAREAARYYGTEHREIRVPPVTPDVIEQTVWHLDEPMTDPSAVPLFLLCREARRDVTVCMSGEGGDEVFIGYDRFIASKADRLYRMLPRALRRGVIEPLVTRLPDQEQKKGPVVVLRRFIEGARLDPGGFTCAGSISGPMRSTAASSETVLRSVDRDRFAPIRQASARCNSDRQLDREVFVDTRFTMPDSVLMKVDKMSMAHALEIRVPLLDHHLIELAATIPPRLKFPASRRARSIAGRSKGCCRRRSCTGQAGLQPAAQAVAPERAPRLHGAAAPGLRGGAPVPRPAGSGGADRRAPRPAREPQPTLWALINLTLWHRRFIEGA